MSSIQPAQHKSPLVPSLFKTIRSGYSLGMLSKDVSAGITVGVVALPLALAFAIASGLTPDVTENGNVSFGEARLVLECRKLYAEALKPECFLDKAIASEWYAAGDFHKMYIVEILNAWGEE